MGLCDTGEAVIFLDSPDSARNTTTPGDNSGWQYEGKFNTFLGVPIAPYFFITAKHIGGSVGTVFDFHGDLYTTIAAHPSPNTDLQIWEVDHSKPFPSYAPLATAAGDVGTTATIMGRGTRRGPEVIVDDVLRGWRWGASDDVQRWGRNEVEGVINGGPSEGQLLYCNMNNPGLPDECHLSTGDSGGGMFVLENGLWRLAGINYSVEGPYRTSAAGTDFNAALFDQRGLYMNTGSWTLVTGAGAVPSGFVCSRISASQSWITSVTGVGSSLPVEDFGAWRKLYFTPVEIANDSTTGPAADFDGDEINNLLEFALNLDPTFNQRAIMQSSSGLRGLPAMGMQIISGEEHLTIEFVRRTTTSVSGLVYIPQFASDLEDWQTVGTETVTPINSRWERVKVVDSISNDGTAGRFARVKVVLTD
jgi:hypothetical protein